MEPPSQERSRAKDQIRVNVEGLGRRHGGPIQQEVHAELATLGAIHQGFGFFGMGHRRRTGPVRLVKDLFPTVLLLAHGLSQLGLALRGRRKFARGLHDERMHSERYGNAFQVPLAKELEPIGLSRKPSNEVPELRG
jgi:hypothetical protein